MNAGVLYVADEEHVPEAVASADSVAEAMPEIPIAIATDAGSVPDVFDERCHVSMDDWDWDVRIRAFRESPFDRTLYLDTDTFVTTPIDGVFELLDEYDVAAAHAPVRHSSMLMDTGLTTSSPPDCFPEFNCGVLLYKDNPAVTEMMQAWEDRFLEYRDASDDVHDQPAFREAVYETPVRIATLPTEYNCRLPFHGFVSDEVKIIHGVADDYDRLDAALNSRSGPRTFKCVSFGHNWEVLYGPGRLRSWLAKLRIVVRDKSAGQIGVWVKEKALG